MRRGHVKPFTCPHISNPILGYTPYMNIIEQLTAELRRGLSLLPLEWPTDVASVRVVLSAINPDGSMDSVLVARLLELCEDIISLQRQLDRVAVNWGEYIASGETAPYCGHGYTVRGFRGEWEVSVPEVVDSGSRKLW